MANLVFVGMSAFPAALTFALVFAMRAMHVDHETEVRAVGIGVVVFLILTGFVARAVLTRIAKRA